MNCNCCLSLIHRGVPYNFDTLTVVDSFLFIGLVFTLERKEERENYSLLSLLEFQHISEAVSFLIQQPFSPISFVLLGVQLQLLPSTFICLDSQNRNTAPSTSKSLYHCLRDLPFYTLLTGAQIRQEASQCLHLTLRTEKGPQ